MRTSATSAAAPEAAADDAAEQGALKPWYRTRPFSGKVWVMLSAGHNYIGNTYIGTCFAPLKSPRRGGRFEYRHAYIRAIEMPSAMADVVCDNAAGQGALTP